ncbi:hypothetical protein BC828DRAFT_133365 [Blastocladiella britannica]|nr:hypothetical protein BC828DRAFT_133365 [Blastocladiella britannica]
MGRIYAELALPVLRGKNRLGDRFQCGRGPCRLLELGSAIGRRVQSALAVACECGIPHFLMGNERCNTSRPVFFLTLFGHIANLYEIYSHTMVQTKKKQKKNADFQKTKLKVGKPLGPSANNTVIDMASKTLIIPGQSIAVDKSDTIKTRRNLTLRELLSHIKHHNAGVRRDALNGIIELLEVHPMLLYLHLGSIMEALIPMVTDEDETVRKSLLSTLEHALDMLEPNHIQSFISLVVVHLTSAMNHIYEDVRIGALPFLALWTDRFASHFIPHASELLGNFVGMLDSGGSGNSGGWSHSQHGAAASSAMAHGSGGGAPGSRLASTTVRTRVFRAVGQFLALLQVNAGAGIGGGGSSSASSSSSSAMAFTSTLWSPVAMPTAAAPLPFSLFASSSGSQAGVSGASTARLSFFASGSASASSPAGFAVHQSSEAVLALADALSPAVLAFWMEGAAGVFGKAAVLAGDALDLCASALQVLVHVLRFYGAGDPTSVIPAQWAGAFENNILRHIGARFPFGEGPLATRMHQHALH